jgi:hypothetical protein
MRFAAFAIMTLAGCGSVAKGPPSLHQPTHEAVPLKWQPRTVCGGGSLNSIWGNGQGILYVGGGTWGETVTSNGCNTYSQPASPDVGVTLQPMVALWGTGPTDVYSAGAGIAHYDGKPHCKSCAGYFEGFYDFVPQATSGNFTAIWGSSGTDVYALDPKQVWHSTGNGTWAPTGTIGGNVIWGSGSKDIYVGSSGDTLIYHSTDGTNWSSQLGSGSAHAIRGIWGSEADDLYAVGDGGQIFRSNGNGQWVAQESGTTQDLHAVWGCDDANIYAVGASATLLYSRGNGKWETVESGLPASVGFNAIWGSSCTEIYVVGDSVGLIQGSKPTP